MGELVRLCLIAEIAGVGVITATAPARAGVDIEIPVIVFDASTVDVDGARADDELDLANIVQSAAKGVTTVQEAPAIVTIVTAEEIRSRGYQNMAQLVDSVPGWMRNGGLHSEFEFPITSGVVISTMLLHNGVSLLDPVDDIPALGRQQSLETIKRVELITGPGGVLWGASSLLGLINVITKDARDVDGVEAGFVASDGNGDRAALRGYVMAGLPHLFDDRAELFAHASFETFRGPGFQMPSLLYGSPIPQPNSDAIYGPLTRAEPARSMIFNLDGKLTVGEASLIVQAPFVQHHHPLGFAGFVTREHWKEDSFRLPDGSLACPYEEPYVVAGDRCLDKGRKARDNEINVFDRYLMASYRHRSASGVAGVTVNTYGIELHRDYVHLGGLNAVPTTLEGGLAFRFDHTSYRVGTNLDADRELGARTRLLYGGEVFREWAPRDVTRSRQGDGVETVFFAPLELARLPLPCPREPDPDSPGRARIIDGCPLTMVFPTSRTVLGAYLNPQWRPTRKLILDAGARLQVAPSALSLQPYDLTSIFSGALVYNFLPDWHVKLNYAEGFRPPFFNATASNGEAVQVDGEVDLAVETSSSIQGELNARLFRGERGLREITFRADYSYNRLENEMLIVAGRYENTADRGTHSGELLAKIYVQGGHRLELGYTFVRVNAADIGIHKSMPEHWFNLTGVFDVVDDALLLTTNLRVMGAMEDPNRLIEYRDLGYDEAGGVIDTTSGEPTLRVVQPHELTMDRLPPSAELTLGATLTPSPRLRLSVFTYNTFNARYYQPDAYFSYEPRLEYLPNPAADFSARMTMSYEY